MKQLHEQKVRLYLAGAGLIALTVFLVNESLNSIEHSGMQFGSLAFVFGLQAIPFLLYVALVRGRAVGWATGIVLLGILVYTGSWIAASEDAQAGFAFLSGALLETLAVLVVSALQLGTWFVKRSFTNKPVS